MIQYLLIDPSEAAALDVAAEVQFGEIHNVDFRPPSLCEAKLLVKRELTDGQLDFINLLRNQDVRFIDTITVHNGQPAIVEIKGASHGLNYIRKLKIKS